MTRRRTRAMSAVTLVIALLAGVVAFLAPSAPARAAGGGTLTASFQVLNAPVWGDDLSLTVGMNQTDDTGTGWVDVYVDDPGSTKTLLGSYTEMGTVAASTRDLTAGTHQLVATAHLNGLTSTAVTRTATIVHRETSVAFDWPTAFPGRAFTLRVTSDSASFTPASGSVTFTVDGAEHSAPVGADGTAALTGLTVGSHDVSAVFTGDERYLASPRISTKLFVQKFTPRIDGAVSAKQVTAGQPVSLRMQITGGDATHLPSGAWTLRALSSSGGDPIVVDSGTYAGTGDIDVDLTAWALAHVGTWNLQVDYAGNDDVNGLTAWQVDFFTVTAGATMTPTTTEIVVPQPSVSVGGQVMVQIHAASGSPAGTVTLFSDEGAVLGTGTASNGVALVTLSARVTAGTWGMRASYGGSAAHQPSESALVDVVVTDPSQPLSTTTAIVVPSGGVPVGGQLTVNVSSAVGTPGGAVILLDGTGQPVVAGTAVAGVAQLTLPSWITAGTHQFTARYGGNVGYLPSDSALTTVTVVAPAGPGIGPGTGTGTGTGTGAGSGTGKATSSVTGKVSGGRGKAVLSVAVTGAPAPTGTVQIRDGRKLLRTVSLKRGRISLTLKRLKKGRHRLTVTYLGSATVSGSAHTWTVRVR